jgi:hypothetical protein
VRRGALGVVDQSAELCRTPRWRGADAMSEGGQGHDLVVWLEQWPHAVRCPRRYPERMQKNERFLAGDGPDL